MSQQQYELFARKRYRTQIFITADDIILLEPSITTKDHAYKTIKAIRKWAKKDGKAAITVETYCAYRKLTPNETIEVKRALNFKIEQE